MGAQLWELDATNKGAKKKKKEKASRNEDVSFHRSCLDWSGHAGVDGLRVRLLASRTTHLALLLTGCDFEDPLTQRRSLNFLIHKSGNDRSGSIQSISSG